MSELKTESVSREVITSQLLVALDDKSKVAILASEQDLRYLIVSLHLSQRYSPCDQKQELLDGLENLKDAAFGSHSEPKDIEMDKFPRQSMPKVNGDTFRCAVPAGLHGEDCGCNVFTEYEQLKYRCNSCGALYAGEVPTKDVRNG